MEIKNLSCWFVNARKRAWQPFLVAQGEDVQSLFKTRRGESCAHDVTPVHGAAVARTQAPANVDAQSNQAAKQIKSSKDSKNIPSAGKIKTGPKKCVKASFFSSLNCSNMSGAMQLEEYDSSDASLVPTKTVTLKALSPSSSGVYVGAKVQKQFVGHGMFAGTVTGFVAHKVLAYTCIW
jgi:hypothetical protein